MQQPNLILSLFSGIGSIERGIIEAGCDHQFQVTQFVEANPYRRAVLARQYPHIPCHNDVRTFNSTQGQFSIIVGGSPCQGISGANTKGKGLDDDRSRLWYQMLRLINECRPQFVIWENVSSARRPKPGQPESVLGTVLRSLASIGFDAEWQTISAASLGAPHRRKRIFVIAYPNGAFKSLDQVPHSWSRQIGADLALARDNSPRSSQHARTQGVVDGTASWLHGYHREGWWTDNKLPHTISILYSQSSQSRPSSASPWRCLHTTTGSSLVEKNQLPCRTSLARSTDLKNWQATHLTTYQIQDAKI